MSDSLSQPQSTSQSLRTSDPAILHVSDPSIRAMQRTANIMKFIFVFLAFFAVAALLCSALLYRSKKENYAREKQQAEDQAAEVKHIIPQSMTPDEVFEEDVQKLEPKTILFSLFTTPAGADVYLDNNYLGTTPIEQLQMDKSLDTHKLVIVRDGYDITRQNITFDENYSDAITLNEKVVVDKTAILADDSQTNEITENVFENKGITVTEPVKKNKNKGKSKSAAAPINTGIILPD